MGRALLKEFPGLQDSLILDAVAVAGGLAGDKDADGCEAAVVLCWSACGEKFPRDGQVGVIFQAQYRSLNFLQLSKYFRGFSGLRVSNKSGEPKLSAFVVLLPEG